MKELALNILHIAGEAISVSLLIIRFRIALPMSEGFIHQAHGKIKRTLHLDDSQKRLVACTEHELRVGDGSPFSDAEAYTPKDIRLYSTRSDVRINAQLSSPATSEII